MRYMKHLLFLTLFAPSLAFGQWHVPVGDTSLKIPFVALDSTTKDRLTTVATVTCRRLKNGTDAACGTASGSLSAATYEDSDANHPGQWHYDLAAGDVDTAGVLTLTLTATGMDTVTVPIQVGNVPAKINDVATNAIEEQDLAARGTAQSVTSSTLVMASSEAFGDNELRYNTEVCIASASTGAGQCRCVTGNTGSSDTLNISPNWTTTPTGTITYSLKSSSACRLYDSSASTYVGTASNAGGGGGSSSGTRY